jgi:hypothetical protein
MRNHRNPRPNVPKEQPTDNPPDRTTDARPHIAAMRELAVLGWHVTEIRPDREPPVLWSVSIRRYDGNVEMTISEADPDAALDELLHYAAADEDEPSVELSSESPPAAAPPASESGQ